MKPVQTNTSKQLLASHRQHPPSSSRSQHDRDDMYSLPSFSRKESSSSRPRHSLRNGGDLADLLENEGTSRLAVKHRLRECTDLHLI